MSNAKNEWPCLFSLPETTLWKIGSTYKAIRAAVKQEQSKLTEALLYIVLSNVPPKLVEDSNVNSDLIGGKNVRVFYDKKTRYLILKLLSGPHEVAERGVFTDIRNDSHANGHRS